MRDTGPLAAAVVLSVLAHFGLPSAATDSLRGTLVLLPLIVTALVAIGRWARERGGLPTPEPIAMGEAVLLLLLVLTALARNHLGLRSSDLIDRCLAGGFVILLGHRLGWLLRSLVSSRERWQNRLAPAPFFALPFIVYLAILPWTTHQRPPDGDAPHYLLLTHSLAHDFDSDLRNNYQQGDSLAFMDLRLEPQLGDPEGGDGELYSRHNLLMPLVLAPFYRLGGLSGVLAAMAAITAGTGWLTLALVRCYDPDLKTEPILAWAVLSFTAPFLLFSYQVWVEIPAAFLVIVALIQIHTLRSRQPSSRWAWMLLFASLFLLPLLKIRFLLVSVPLALLAFLQGDRRLRRGAALLLVFLMVLAGGIFLFNLLVFQNPLKYHDIDGLRSYSQPATQYFRGLVGLFFDCAFGLFANAPVWMLLMPAVIVLARRRHRALLDFCIVFAPYLALLSPRGEWFGGWSPPFRYGIVMLPMLAVLLVPVFRQRDRAGSRVVLVLLLTTTLVLTTLWIVMPGWTFNLAHGRSHVLDQLSTRVAADVARFFPSSTRLRAATYLWPPISFALVTLLWLRWRRSAWNGLALWSVAVALLSPALLVWAGQNRTTHVIEFEDPWFSKEAGSVYPDLWVVYRPRYQGGWRLPEDSPMPLAAVAGGNHADLKVDLYLEPKKGREAVLEVRDGNGELLRATRIHEFGQWLTVTLEDLAWTADEPVTLSFHGPPNRRARNYAAILDRATFTWRREDPGPGGSDPGLSR